MPKPAPTHWYEDTVRPRFVIHRTANGITRRHCIPYGPARISKQKAQAQAVEMAARLKACDPTQLASFRFYP